MAAADRPSQALLNAQKELEKRRLLAGISYRPPQVPSSNRAQPGWLAVPTAASLPQTTTSPTKPVPAQAEVRLSPTLAAYCLDKKHRHQGHALDAPYRLYKILQTLDQGGRGWLANSFVGAALTRKESPRYIYGRRQLKNILQRGEGLFWQRAKSKGELRIRLVARAKVASQLLDGRLRGQEVSFPLQHLLGSGRGRQAAVNAALYTAVHAGQITRKGKAGPISRARLRDISGCSSYRQRRYEKHMGITIATHIHILGRHSEYDLQRARRHQGLPAYKHTDYLRQDQPPPARRGLHRPPPAKQLRHTRHFFRYSFPQTAHHQPSAGRPLPYGQRGQRQRQIRASVPRECSIGRSRFQAADNRVLPACRHSKHTVMALAVLILHGDLD